MRIPLMDLKFAKARYSESPLQRKPRTSEIFKLSARNTDSSPSPLPGTVLKEQADVAWRFRSRVILMVPMPKAERDSAVTDRAPVADRASAVCHCPKIFEVQYVVSL